MIEPMADKATKSSAASRRLFLVKAVHTAIWAVLAGGILAIPVVGWAEMYGLVLGLNCIVLAEIFALALNDGRCPLSGVAARLTDDRRDGFDIFIPAWLARHNKLIFGSLFVVGEAVAFMRWRGWIG